jgi:hypothetical protein
MKNLRKIGGAFVFAVCAMLFISWTNKPNTSGKFLIMQVDEVSYNRFKDKSTGRITIVNEDGKTEEIALHGEPLSNPVLAATNKTLNDVAARGYKLISATESGWGSNHIRTFTFIKE